MQPPDASDDLVISTPERVAFQYEIAGIGSRFLAQILDSLVITVILIAITILATSMGGLFGSGELVLMHPAGSHRRLHFGPIAFAGHDRHALAVLILCEYR